MPDVAWTFKISQVEPKSLFKDWPPKASKSVNLDECSRNLQQPIMSFYSNTVNQLMISATLAANTIKWCSFTTSVFLIFIVFLNSFIWADNERTHTRIAQHECMGMVCWLWWCVMPDLCACMFAGQRWPRFDDHMIWTYLPQWRFRHAIHHHTMHMFLLSCARVLSLKMTRHNVCSVRKVFVFFA